jgi:ornithine decarboxylase
MDSRREEFRDTGEMLRAWRPRGPVCCIHPQVYRQTAKAFLDGFAGRVLYAVKANSDPRVLRLLNTAGGRHFDCASLAEEEQVSRHCPGAACYFMTPVAPRADQGAPQNWDSFTATKNT